MQLYYPSAPIIIVGIFAYIIANIFFNVYEVRCTCIHAYIHTYIHAQMIIDTLFICFCEDSERNDGSIDKPYYMSDTLMEVSYRHPD